MSNRYSHPPSKKCDFFRCKSRFSCVSAAFQLRFSYVSAHSKFFFLRLPFFLVPKYPRSSKSNFWSNFLFYVSAAFQLAKTGCSPSAMSTTAIRHPVCSFPEYSCCSASLYTVRSLGRSVLRVAYRVCEPRMLVGMWTLTENLKSTGSLHIRKMDLHDGPLELLTKRARL